MRLPELCRGRRLRDNGHRPVGFIQGIAGQHLSRPVWSFSQLELQPLSHIFRGRQDGPRSPELAPVSAKEGSETGGDDSD